MINLTLTEEEFEKIMKKSISKNIEIILDDIKEQVSHYQKDNQESIYNDQLNHLFDVRDKEQQHKKVVANINEEVIKKAKEFQDSNKNIYGLNLGEIIEISLRIFLGKMYEVTEEERIKYLK